MSAFQIDEYPLHPEARTADGYDEAIIGIAPRTFGGDPVVVYSADKIIDILAREMTVEEAEEFFSFNIEGAYVGPGTPIYVRSTD